MYPITLIRKLEDVEICGMKLAEIDHPVFEFSWEIIIWMRQIMVQSSTPKAFGVKVQSCSSKFQVYNSQADVLVGQNVKIADYVTFEPSGGHIIIDDNVKIEPFSFIEGPCYIGQHCEIMPHSQIRKNTSIGHHCKIGGEVSGSIFQPYSNKAHYGFVGDSYIGSWVNLGAGTTTSNLKNTYGNVKCQISPPEADPPLAENDKSDRIDTGQQFLGCIMGDYVKTAINTSIYTGKIIGVCAQLFGVVDENVGSFVMKMPDGSQKVFELDAAIRCQKRMFERRGVAQTADDVKMLEKVFEETKEERLF